MARCYDCDVREAKYEARIAWTQGVMLLCDDCAIWERGGDSVIEIHSLAREG